MKKYLRIIFPLFTMAAMAQAPISSFYPNGTQTAYLAVSATPAFDQSASGEFVVWNLVDALVSVGTSTSVVRNATAEENTEFPQSSTVLETTTDTGGDTASGRILWNSTANTVSITGIATDAFTLNYTANNGLIGTFPLTYGYQNTDAVSGNFEGMGYAGTFSGTLTTSVDAYGEVILNLDGVFGSATVTRLKTTQTLSLNYIFPNIGTVTQTIYNYYSLDFSVPILRSTQTYISVPMLGIDEVTESLEVFAEDLLSTPSLETSAAILYPNPASDRIFISSEMAVEQVQIYDLSGRELLKFSDIESGIDISTLPQGIYLAELSQGKSRQVKRFVKH